MKQKGVHEDCIAQIARLFSQRLYAGNGIPVDPQGRIRIDDFEMREDIQEEVERLWESVDTENVQKIADVKGYEEDFLRLFGFGFPQVDYNADVNPDINF